MNLHRLSSELRVDPELGWVKNAYHSFGNPKAEGAQWPEYQALEHLVEFLEANGVND